MQHARSAEKHTTERNHVSVTEKRNKMTNLNEGKRGFILWVGSGVFYFRLHYKLPAIYFRYRKAAETWEDIDGDLPTQAPNDKENI